MSDISEIANFAISKTKIFSLALFSRPNISCLIVIMKRVLFLNFSRQVPTSTDLSLIHACVLLFLAPSPFGWLWTSAD